MSDRKPTTGWLNAKPKPVPPPRPNRPPRKLAPTIKQPDEIPEDITLWNIEMLRVLGWHSKAEEQKQTQREIQQLLGREYDEESAPIIEELAVQHGELSLNLQRNGVWSSAEEMKAAEIKATLLFENMPNKRAQLQGGSANPTFWITSETDDGSKREFLFKPSPPNALMPGVASGGDVPREAMTGRVAEMLGAFTGIDFSMPTTNVISVDSARLRDYAPDDEFMALPKTDRIVGSLQTFAPNEGDLRGDFCSIRESVSPKECQKIVLLDTVILNLDRHDGNLLLGKDGTLIPIDHGLSFPTKTTIETGNVTLNMVSDKNAMLRLRGSYEPFSDEMLDAIEKIDPLLLSGGMSGELGKIGQAHPDTEGSLPTESLIISRLSTRFLKLAAPRLSPAVLQVALGMHAKRLLDPAALADLDSWDTAAEEAIVEYEAKAGSVQTYWMMAGDERDAIISKIRRDGLFPTSGTLDPEWLFANIELILAYGRSDATMPPRPQASPPQIPRLDGEQIRDAVKRLIGLSLDRKKEGEWTPQWQRLCELAGGAPDRLIEQTTDWRVAHKEKKSPKTLAEFVQSAEALTQDKERKQREIVFEAMLKVFPTMTLPTDESDIKAFMADATTFRRLGGLAALRKAKDEHFPTARMPSRLTDAIAMLQVGAPPSRQVVNTKRLDYLDRIQQADPTLFDDDLKGVLRVARNAVNGDALTEKDVEELVNRGVASAVTAMVRRFEDLELRLPLPIWKQYEDFLSKALLAGNVLDILPDLQRFEQQASPDPIREK